MYEENRKRLKEYQKNYRETKKYISQSRYINKSALQNCCREDIFCSLFY